MRIIKILRSKVGLLNVHHNENVMLVFYVKYSVNVFQKNTIQNAKNPKKIMEIVKNYPLNVLQIVIKFCIFL